MTLLSSMQVRDLVHADDREALELEQRCPQGGTFQITFARKSFLLRTQAFEHSRLLGAWVSGRLIAVGGGAIKKVHWDGKSTTGLMLYDFRVHPEWRRSGVGRLLTETLIEWAKPQAEIGFAYAMGDNRAIQAMAREWIDADVAPAFDLFVYPTHRRRSVEQSLEVASVADVRTQYLRHRSETELLCDLDAPSQSGQLIASWQLEDPSSGGCSTWTTAGVLEEVVTRLPWPLRIASWPMGGKLARTVSLPHVPRLGETLRSWLVFDGYAKDEVSARSLFAAVASKAREAEVDHCHLVLEPGSPLSQALHRDVSRTFSPIIPFTIMARILAGGPLKLSAPIIDPSDI